MDRLEALLAQAQSALDEVLATVRSEATEALTNLAAGIDALSAKVDAIQAAWDERKQAEQLPADDA